MTNSIKATTRNQASTTSKTPNAETNRTGAQARASIPAMQEKPIIGVVALKEHLRRMNEESDRYVTAAETNITSTYTTMQAIKDDCYRPGNLNRAKVCFMVVAGRVKECKETWATALAPLDAAANKKLTQFRADKVNFSKLVKGAIVAQELSNATAHAVEHYMRSLHATTQLLAIHKLPNPVNPKDLAEKDRQDFVHSLKNLQGKITRTTDTDSQYALLERSIRILETGKITLAEQESDFLRALDLLDRELQTETLDARRKILEAFSEFDMDTLSAAEGLPEACAMWPIRMLNQTWLSALASMVAQSQNSMNAFEAAHERHRIAISNNASPKNDLSVDEKSDRYRNRLTELRELKLSAISYHRAVKEFIDFLSNSPTLKVDAKETIDDKETMDEKKTQLRNIGWSQKEMVSNCIQLLEDFLNDASDQEAKSLLELVRNNCKTIFNAVEQHVETANNIEISNDAMMKSARILPELHTRAAEEIQCVANLLQEKNDIAHSAEMAEFLHFFSTEMSAMRRAVELHIGMLVSEGVPRKELKRRSAEDDALRHSINWNWNAYVQTDSDWDEETVVGEMEELTGTDAEASMPFDGDPVLRKNTARLERNLSRWLSQIDAWDKDFDRSNRRASDIEKALDAKIKKLTEKGKARTEQIEALEARADSSNTPEQLRLMKNWAAKYKQYAAERWTTVAGIREKLKHPEAEIDEARRNAEACETRAKELEDEGVLLKTSYIKRLPPTGEGLLYLISKKQISKVGQPEWIALDLYAPNGNRMKDLAGNDRRDFILEIPVTLKPEKKNGVKTQIVLHAHYPTAERNNCLTVHVKEGDQAKLGAQYEKQTAETVWRGKVDESLIDELLELASNKDPRALAVDRPV